MMRLSAKQVARAEELLPRAKVLKKRHGIDLNNVVNPAIPVVATGYVEGVLHELAHFIVMERPPGRGVTGRIESILAPFSIYVTDELEIDTSYTVLEAGVELGLWNARDARATIIASCCGAMRGDSNTARIQAGFRQRERRRNVTSSDRIRWLVDWFLHDEAREAWNRVKILLVKDERAANAPKAPVP